MKDPVEVKTRMIQRLFGLAPLELVKHSQGGIVLVAEPAVQNRTGENHGPGLGMDRADVWDSHVSAHEDGLLGIDGTSGCISSACGGRRAMNRPPYNSYIV